MITIQENIEVGDIVSVWISPFKEKNVKKHDEYEFRVGLLSKDRIKLCSLNGGCSITYTKELLENWNGNIRKAR